MKLSAYTLIFLMMLFAASCGHRGEEHETTEAHEHGGHDEHGEHGEESEEIELSQKQMETVGITLGTVSSRVMTEGVHATGELAVSSLSEGTITSRFSGILTKVLIKEGDYVKAGQVVAYIQSQELAPLQQEYLNAMAEEKMARQEYERQKTLAEHGAGIRKNLDQAGAALNVAEAKTLGIARRIEAYGVKATGSNYVESFPVKSEVSGRISNVTGRTGGYADMQTPIATVIDNSALYCILNIFEKDIPKIKVGQSVDLKMTNNPTEPFIGKIAEIYQSFDTETKTVPVKVTISGARGTLIPGMAVSGLINTSNVGSETVPEDAVVSSGGRYYIFMLEDTHQEDGEKKYCFVKKEVNIGVTEMGFVEIMPIDEIPPEAQIVTSNAFYLNSMSSDHGEHSH